MNYKITQVRLSSIGHAAARYDPLTIDLRSASGNEAQDSVLWLENGGGKTALLRLMFSVLCPAKADTIGPPTYDSNGRARPNLPLYLRDRDTGHVAIEWRPTEGDTIVGDEVLITGLVAEYRGRRWTGRLGDVVRHWYLVRSDDGRFEIGDLPFEEAGRPFSASRFVERLADLERRGLASARRSPIRVRHTDRREQWMTLLEDIGLDPVLFEYQAQMNHTEGAAGSVFSFRSDLAFVRFLLEILTPEETLQTLTAEVRDVLEKLRSQPSLRLEHDFVAGAIPSLETIARAEERLRAALESQRETRGAARLTRAQFAAAAAAAERRLAELAHAETEANRLKGEADTRRRRLEEEARAHRWYAANFRHATTESGLGAAQEEDHEADLVARAWPYVRGVRRVEELDGEIAAAAVAVTQTDVAVAPLRAERDTAGTALRRHLEARRIVTSSLADREADLAFGLRREAEELARTARDAARQAERSRSSAEALTERVRDVRVQRVAAAGHGALATEDESTESALGRHQIASNTASARITWIDQRTAVIKDRLDEIAKLERAETVARSEAKAAGTELAPRVTAAEAERARLVTAPRVLALLDTEPDLELAGHPLIERLHVAAGQTDRSRIEHESRGADDRRAAAALQTSGLLPGPLELERALSVLHDAGIPGARLGTHYLQEAVLAAQHARAFDRAPELAGGIVLTDPARLADAHQALVATGIEGLDVITVGLADDLLDAAEREDEVDAVRGRRAVLPPAAGTHDRDAASAAQAPLVARIEEADVEAARLADLANADRQLAQELTEHLKAWPAGELAARRADLAEFDRRTAAADARLTQLGAERSNLLAEREALTAELPRLRAAVSAAERAVSTLESLAALETALGDAPTRIADLEREGGEWDGIERDSDAAAATKRTEADEAIGRATQFGQEASSISEAADRIAVNTPVAIEASEAEAIVVGGDESKLAATYERLDALVTAKTTGSKEAARLEQLQRERDSQVRELEGIEPDLRSHAETLAAEPAAQSREGRTLATRQARDRRERAAAALRRATTDEETARARLEEIAAEGRRADLPADEVPLDRFVADRRAASLGEDVAKAYAAFSRHEAAERAAQDEQTPIRTRGSAMATSARLLGSLLIGEPEALAGELLVEPFAGDEQAADDLRDALIARSHSATAEIGTAQGELAEGQTDLRGAIAGARFRELLATPLGRQLDGIAVRPAEATRLLEEATKRRDRLAADLESMSIHREVLTRSLVGAAGAALATLTTAQRRSKLPDGLGDWSGQSFLRISFRRPGSTDEMGARVQTLVADYTKAGPEAIPTGLDLLMQSVETAVVGGFEVTVLKPNAGFAVEPIPIIEVGGLSGGQRATAAAALMMMLAEMRSARASNAACRVGTLMLDNPFGSASALFLVDAQRKVAEASGIQLVYTTGLRDYNAIRPFRNLVGLANSRARGTHLRWVTGDDAVIASLRAEAEGERLYATRVSRSGAPADA